MSKESFVSPPTAQGDTLVHLDSPELLVLLEGRAMLRVTFGSLDVFGRRLGANKDIWVPVAADARDGGALVLRPAHAVPVSYSGPLVVSASRLASSTAGTSFEVKQDDLSDISTEWFDMDTADGTRISSTYRLHLVLPPPSPPPPIPLPATPYLAPCWTRLITAHLAPTPPFPLAPSSPATPPGADPSWPRPPLLPLPSRPPLVYVICGYKGCGKSTFSRLLTNHLLNIFPMVYHLETDPGQPEFTPPGLISLTPLSDLVTGPPVLHPRTPLVQQYLGDTSAESDPIAYLSAIQLCIDAYRAQLSLHAGATNQQPLPPLVVNTHGWVKGLGYDLLVDLIRSLGPSHVVALKAENEKNNVPPGRFWALDGDQGASERIIHVPGIQVALSLRIHEGASVALAPSRSAADTRAAQWLGFARRCCSMATSSKDKRTSSSSSSMDANDEARWGTVARRLVAARPFVVSLHALQVRALFGQSLDTTAPESVLRALNGALVGLGKTRDDGVVADMCLGHGLVRGVHLTQGLLYILTDVPLHALQSCNMLWLGRLELPPLLLQTDALVSPYVSPFGLVAGEKSGSVAIRSRNNIPRGAQAG